jgi:hypothetical protein
MRRSGDLQGYAQGHGVNFGIDIAKIVKIRCQSVLRCCFDVFRNFWIG